MVESFGRDTPYKYKKRWQCRKMRCACYNPDRRRSAEPFSAILGTRELPYMRTRPNVRHSGQLKLLLSEIPFLERFRGVPHTVIYAGASPGLHIPRLARMFPEMRFVLVDPQPSIVDDPRIEVIRGLMTDRLARELAARHGPDTLLVSDVRVGGAAGETDTEQQARIQNDMQSQMVWHDILDPVASIFKFRLPWDLEPYTEYLDGEIHLPVFGKHLTHEARLVVERGAQRVDYDNGQYERRMAYFNRVQRVAIYEGGRCYDCTAFRRIIAEYLGGYRGVEAMCRDIERELEQMGRMWAVLTRRRREFLRASFYSWRQLRVT